jgi:hypothetical protein
MEHQLQTWRTGNNILETKKAKHILIIQITVIWISVITAILVIN